MIKGQNTSDGVSLMTLAAMERTLSRLDTMIDMLTKRMNDGTADPQAIRQAITRYRQRRDDLDVEISLERIRRGTYQPRTRPLLHS
jgi:hypothetical protein